MGEAFRVKVRFFGHLFRDPAPTRRKAAPTPKITAFSSKSDQQVPHKLTHLVSLCSLRNSCGELGDPKMAPSFALYVLLFCLRAHGENNSRGRSDGQ